MLHAFLYRIDKQDRMLLVLRTYGFAHASRRRETIMQKFIAEESFWELFPDAAVGIIVIRDMKDAEEVLPEDATAITKLLREANERANTYLTSNTISENEVVRVWRDAYQRFKTKKGARCSIENLLKRVLKGNPVGSITPSVDIYNAISLKYALPVGGEDIDAFAGDLRLGITQGGDAFRALGEDKDDPTLAGELCYRDDEGAVCRCFNWRDGQRTALKDDSKNAFLVIECVDPARVGELKEALDEFAGLMERYLGAHVAVRAVVDRTHPDVIIAE